MISGSGTLLSSKPCEKLGQPHFFVIAPPCSLQHDIVPIIQPNINDIPRNPTVAIYKAVDVGIPTHIQAAGPHVLGSQQPQHKKVVPAHIKLADAQSEAIPLHCDAVYREQSGFPFCRQQSYFLVQQFAHLCPHL